MVQSNSPAQGPLGIKKPLKRSRLGNPHVRLREFRQGSADLINEMYGPIDAANRYINLTLDSVEEDSRSREFLLESKKGLRKTVELLRKLDDYTRHVELELRRFFPGKKDRGPDPRQ